MQKITVKPGPIKGTISIPPSKSQTLRAILFASLANGKSIIDNFLPSPDAFAMISACKHLGAKIEGNEKHLTIQGLSSIAAAEDVLNAGNSGIVLRFLTALASLSSYPIVITGDHSIRHQRPMQPLLEALSMLSVDVISTKGDGFAPLIIKGPLKPGKTQVRAEDSQYVSALLIASALASGPIEIEALNSGEKPWVDLTLHWLDRLGISYERKGYEWYRVTPAAWNGFYYKVPADFSTALFPMIAALATRSEITIDNLDFNDPQGDKKVIDIIRTMGGNIDIQGTSLKVFPSQLKGIEVNINDCIDAITPLSVLGCFAEGETRIYGAGGARHKECDRISSTVKELSKLGASIVDLEDGLAIKKSSLKGSLELSSHHDHRMALSLICAALGAEKKSTVHDTQCIHKTFPEFVSCFSSMGAVLEVT